MIGALVLQREFFQRHASLPLFLPLALLGLPSVWRAKRLWLPVMLYVALLIGTVSMTIPIDRYILSIIPPWIVLAGAGGCRLWKFGSSRHRIGGAARVATVVLVIGATVSHVRAAITEVKCDRYGWCPSGNYCALEATAASNFIQMYTKADEPILCTEVFHYSLILGRNCIAVPFDDDTLITICKRYNVRYLVIAARDLARRLPYWMEGIPPWANLACHVPADSISRPVRNQDYLQLSDLLIYRLELQD